jgi:hypothetical protein
MLVVRSGVGLLHNLDLRVIDAREVAGTRGLVLLGLEREGVRVDTRVGVPAVVVEGLHLVEVLTRLLLEPVLTVEDQLEGRQRTHRTRTAGAWDRPRRPTHRRHSD